jgi:hypothetical protein
MKFKKRQERSFLYNELNVKPPQKMKRNLLRYKEKVKLPQQNERETTHLCNRLYF